MFHRRDFVHHRRVILQFNYGAKRHLVQHPAGFPHDESYGDTAPDRRAAPE